MKNNKNMRNTQKALNSLAMEINRIAAMTEERHTHMLLNDLHVDIQQIKREQLPLDMEEARNEASSHAYNELQRYAVPSDVADDLSATLYDICSPGEGNLKP